MCTRCAPVAEPRPRFWAPRRRTRVSARSLGHFFGNMSVGAAKVRVPRPSSCSGVRDSDHSEWRPSRPPRNFESRPLGVVASRSRVCRTNPDRRKNRMDRRVRDLVSVAYDGRRRVPERDPPAGRSHAGYECEECAAPPEWTAGVGRTGWRRPADTARRNGLCTWSETYRCGIPDLDAPCTRCGRNCENPVLATPTRQRGSGRSRRGRPSRCSGAPSRWCSCRCIVGVCPVPTSTSMKRHAKPSWTDTTCQPSARL